MALVRPLAEARGIMIEADIDDAALQADATRLKQVIVNLLSNEPLAKLPRANCCAAPFALGERFFLRRRSPWLSG